MKTALDTLRRLTVPLWKFIGPIHVPMKRLTEEQDVNELRPLAVPGAVILSHARWHLTNVFVPGFWNHAGIIGLGDYVIEAVSEGVRRVDFRTWILGKDFIAIVHPLFTTDKIIMPKAALAADGQVGKPYDWEFEWRQSNNKAFYCAELVYWAYKTVEPTMPFELRERMGYKTISPQDFFDAETKWKWVAGC